MGKLSEIMRAVTAKNRFNSAVILAAGSGSRFGIDKPKQFYEIGGLSVLVRTAKAFEEVADIHEIVIVTRRDDAEYSRELLKKNGVTKVTRVIAGGATRQESAKLGFDAVNPECDYVAIHDAARCLITPEMIYSVMERAYARGAAAAGTKAVDSIKKANGANVITETVERENVWLVQTPQVFSANMYRAAAYMAEKDKFKATDDCALCERLGFSVELVECGRANIKITYPEDIIFAEAVIKDRTGKK